MLLTAKEYSKRSKRTVIFCTVVATIVGTIQTGIIIASIRGERR